MHFDPQLHSSHTVSPNETPTHLPCGPALDQHQRGFMEDIPYSELEGNEFRVHYFPHHLVEKSSKTTTKARVVMNAAPKEIGQPSLNDMLEAGPNTQANL